MPANALLIGQIRDRFDFERTLAELFNYRSEGLVEKIVLSTWHGELAKHEGLQDRLTRSGVTVVSSPPIPSSIRPAALRNSWIQASALRNGLDVLPREENVLRLRTDKTLSLLPLFRPPLERGLERSSPPHWLPTIFQRKIAARIVRAAVPLHVADMMFLGAADDLRIIALRDGELEADCATSTIGVENRWLLAPFSKVSARLRSFHASVKPFDFASCLHQWADEGAQGDLPDTVWDVIALNFVIYASFVETMDDRPASSPVDLISLFASNTHDPAWPMPSARGVHKALCNNNVIQSLGSGNVVRNHHGLQYQAALSRLSLNFDVPLGVREKDEIQDFLLHFGIARDSIRTPIRVFPAGSTETTHFSHDDAFSELMIRQQVAPEDRPAIRAIAGDLGNSNAADVYWRIGHAYQSGRGVEKSAELAYRFLQLGADLRQPKAQSAYAQLLIEDGYEPVGEITPNPWDALEDAAKRHKPAAELLERLTQSDLSPGSK